MALKDLLVHVDDSKSCAARIEAAINLALAHDAHLAAVYMMVEPSPASYVRAYLPPEVVENVERQAQELADAALGRFTTAAERNGISFETRIDRSTETDVGEALCVHARYADLAILGQVDPAEEPPTGRHLPEQVALGSGRPVLVIPYIGAPTTFGERVVVAWDARREAARAVNDALPLLERAKSVLVVTVNPRPEPSGHGEEPGADIAAHLARHGIEVEVQRLEARDIDVANTLLSHVASEGADMLVMGAYGHSRLRELVLGGVTRTILADMTVPVFMSH